VVERILNITSNLKEIGWWTWLEMIAVTIDEGI
jgi:hypothetical protein